MQTRARFGGIVPQAMNADGARAERKRCTPPKRPGQCDGGTKTLTMTLAPGTYTYYCSVPGHRQAGMQGTLTVK